MSHGYCCSRSYYSPLMTLSRQDSCQFIHTNDLKGYLDRVPDYSHHATNLNIKTLLLSLRFVFSVFYTINLTKQSTSITQQRTSRSSTDSTINSTSQRPKGFLNTVINILEDLEKLNPPRKFFNTTLCSENFPTPAS